jgi:muramoyltetrapeptide carboxypeptidase
MNESRHQGFFRPPRLQYGDSVGIIAPASGLAARVPRRFERALQHLTDWGFHPVLGKTANSVYGWTSASAQERADDLHDMFANPDIKAILTTIGGNNSNDLYDLLDFDLIAKNPKVFCGYSDISGLLNVITHKTGMMTFLGAALLPQLGCVDGIDPFTKESFEVMTMREDMQGELPTAQSYTDEILLWDQYDSRPQRHQPNTGAQTWCSGEARSGKAFGRLIAGHLDTLRCLIGTQFEPDWTGTILCLELADTDSPATFAHGMRHLQQRGILKQISGLVFGRMHGQSGISGDDTHRILCDTLQATDYPVATGLDFGHTDPMLTLPIGAHGSLECTHQVRFCITSPQ